MIANEEIFDPPIKRGHSHYLAPAKLTSLPCVSACGTYLCTRGKGHEGDHAAHGLDGSQYRRWKREGKS